MFRPANPPFLLISGHDYRSTRQTTIHYVARELERLGPVRFVSVGYSHLSLIKHDPRCALWSHGNIVERHNGVECYLWRSIVHPVSLRTTRFSRLEAASFKTYARALPDTVKTWIKQAQTIILESGMSVVFVDLIKRLNPKVSLIYFCSDALQTIGCARFLQSELRRVAPLFDVCRVAAPELASEFPPGCAIAYIHQGIDDLPGDPNGKSPYKTAINLVSVGSMLFDRQFFEIAIAAFPNLAFHIIGGGAKAASLTGPNLYNYGELPPAKIAAYIKHAQVGVAPYAGATVAPYLADSSMKLCQFEASGLPAICPHAAVGRHVGRFGYTPGDADSIIAAIEAALAYGRFTGTRPYSWAEFTQRLLNPQIFPETQLQH